MSELNIGVLGAGVVGLTTALELQKEYRGAQVTILADTFNEGTTSYVAAGLFRPSTYFTGPTEEITRRWIQDAFDHWDDIRVTEEGAEAGVAQLSGYLFSNVSPAVVQNPLIDKIVPIYRRVTEEELHLCPGDWKYGSFFTSLLIECEIFLPWAAQKFLKAGGKIAKKRINAFSQLSGQFDVTVNCTGIGAKYLCKDYKLVPVRGQVLKVDAPWVKMFFYGDYDTYIIPGFRTITLGGSRHFDNLNLGVCKYDEMRIRERTAALLPSLKSARLVGQRVGLRPHRDPVRVEKEIINSNENRVKIVHNYGHGGYGVTTAPGTAKHAVQLVREILIGNSKI